MTRRRVGVVGLADEQVDIHFACNLVGMQLPGAVDRSTKVHCPFGELYHSDQGVDPAMRIYPDSNSAWCFSCAHYYTPTGLVSRAWNVSRRAAATTLLDRSGYRPPAVEDVWADAVREPEVEVLALAEALKTFCARTAGPRWAAAQFEPGVAGQLDRCLRLLDLVHDEDGGRRWLANCKLAMLDRLAGHPFGAAGP